MTIMLNQQQIDLLCSMDEPRLINYLNGASEEDKLNIIQSLKKHLTPSNLLDNEHRTKCESALSIVECHLNGLLQNGKENEELIEDINGDEMIDLSQLKPLSSKQIIDILGLTIKKDNENKLITFLGMISAYTSDSQFNISFNAPSSSGKSYIPTEIASLFPKNDVIEVGYCSPTAFFHDKAEEYRKKTNELVIDFTGKIIIFLDQPHSLLLQHLRPLLSHDKPEIRLKITDKSQKAGLRTKNVLLKGFPAVVFCTAGLTIDEQESTRFILLSPEINQEKIREGILERIRKSADGYKYVYDLEVNPDRKLLKERIRAIKGQRVGEIIIRNSELIEKKFFNNVKILKPRHQRDMGRILALIKVFALLNLWFRQQEGSNIIVDEADIDAAFNLWEAISEAQELNLPPYIYNLYKEIIQKAYEENNLDDMDIEPQGISRQEILNYHLKIYGRALSDWTLRKEIIPMLVASGLIYQEPDKNDKRKMLIYPTTPSTILNTEKQ